MANLNFQMPDATPERKLWVAVVQSLFADLAMGSNNAKVWFFSDYNEADRQIVFHCAGLDEEQCVKIAAEIAGEYDA